jgi:hypothetical protein
MLATSHLRRLADRHEDARRELFEHRRFGVYLPLSIDWCVALGEVSGYNDRVFTDGVNIVAIQAFLEEVEGAIRVVASDNASIDVSASERQLTRQLCDVWFEGVRSPVHSLAALRRLMRRQESIFKSALLSGNPCDSATLREAGFLLYSSSLFGHVQQGAQMANEVMELERDHSWIVGLDELEVLTDTQQKLLATVVRGTHRPLLFKMATLPYSFTDMGTSFAARARVAENREFRTERLQYDPGDSEYRELVATLGCSILRLDVGTSAERTMERVFGNKRFVERAEEAAKRYELGDGAAEKANITGALRAMHGLKGDSRRKVAPVLAIRILRATSRGHRRPQAYCGWDTAMRVSDGNPSLFLRLLWELDRLRAGSECISPGDQHAAISAQAEHLFTSARALYPGGTLLQDTIDRIGRGFASGIHDIPLDRIDEEGNRFVVDLDALSGVEREAFQWGVRHSLLVGETSTSGSSEYPVGKGVWRLGYALCPKYWLLPRRGRVRGVFQGGQLLVAASDEAGQQLLWGPDSSSEVPLDTRGHDPAQEAQRERGARSSDNDAEAI